MQVGCLLIIIVPLYLLWEYSLIKLQEAEKNIMKWAVEHREWFDQEATDA